MNPFAEAACGLVALTGFLSLALFGAWLTDQIRRR